MSKRRETTIIYMVWMVYFDGLKNQQLVVRLLALIRSGFYNVLFV